MFNLFSGQKKTEVKQQAPAAGNTMPAAPNSQQAPPPESQNPSQPDQVQVGQNTTQNQPGQPVQQQGQQPQPGQPGQQGQPGQTNAANSQTAQQMLGSTQDPNKRQEMSALSHLDPRTTQVLNLASQEATKMKMEHIEPEQILLGLLFDGEIFQLLEQFNLRVADIAREIQSKEKQGTFTGQPTLSEASKKIFDDGYVVAKNHGGAFISPEDVLVALTNAGVAANNYLEAQGFKKEKLNEKLGKKFSTELASVKRTVLEEFGVDLTMQAQKGELDPVAGRDKEIERMTHILLRRIKNNPIIIGEAGVGKTAIVEGLAQKIVAGQVPPDLAKKRIIQLQVASLVAGASHRGEFEERLRNVIKEALDSKGKLILFIDEIHTLMGAGGEGEGGLDASNIIKPFLARGQIQLIGSTTTIEYRKYFQKDKAFERRFQTIVASEPDEENAKKMIEILKPKYEQFHHVVLTPEAIDAAVKLSKRYIGERYLPDKAVDVMDEAAAEVKLMAGNGKRTDMNVTKSDIEKVISMWTGVPISKLTENESEKLLHLEDIIHKRLINQVVAVKAVAEAVRRGRIGLANVMRPIASFIFLGPSGVGKTELAKTLAEILFGKEDAMIRLDMSEYMEKHEVAKLIGAPPGYVGYEEGGQLTEAVRMKPYSVVLLDEVEKAHPDVFNILLQLLEDGRLTDNKGNTISFKNTIIICTSNLGSKVIQEYLISDAANDQTPSAKEDKTDKADTSSSDSQNRGASSSSAQKEPEKLVKKFVKKDPTGKETPMTEAEIISIIANETQKDYYKKDQDGKEMPVTIEEIADEFKAQEQNQPKQKYYKKDPTGKEIEITAEEIAAETKKIRTKKDPVTLLELPMTPEEVAQLPQQLYFKKDATGKEISLTPDQVEEDGKKKYLRKDPVTGAEVPMTPEEIEKSKKQYFKKDPKTHEEIAMTAEEVSEDTKKQFLKKDEGGKEVPMTLSEVILSLSKKGDQTYMKNDEATREFRPMTYKEIITDVMKKPEKKYVKLDPTTLKEVPMTKEEIAEEKHKEKMTELHELVMVELHKFFRPELINRFDEVIVFEPLARKNMLEIAKLRIEATRKLLKEQNVDLQLTDKALEEIAKEGYDPVYGARPLRRLVQTTIENPIASLILSKTFIPGDTILVDYNDKLEKFNFTKGQKAMDITGQPLKFVNLLDPEKKLILDAFVNPTEKAEVSKHLTDGTPLTPAQQSIVDEKMKLISQQRQAQQPKQTPQAAPGSSPTVPTAPTVEQPTGEPVSPLPPQQPTNGATLPQPGTLPTSSTSPMMIPTAVGSTPPAQPGTPTPVVNPTTEPYKIVLELDRPTENPAPVMTPPPGMPPLPGTPDAGGAGVAQTIPGTPISMNANA